MGLEASRACMAMALPRMLQALLFGGWDAEGGQEVGEGWVVHGVGAGVGVFEFACVVYYEVAA